MLSSHKKTFCIFVLLTNTIGVQHKDVLIFRWRRPPLWEGMDWLAGPATDRLADQLDIDLLIVNETSTEARLAPGIVYSAQWSTNSWQFVYAVHSIAQIGPNLAKLSLCTTFNMWHSIILDTDVKQLFNINLSLHGLNFSALNALLTSSPQPCRLWMYQNK